MALTSFARKLGKYLFIWKKTGKQYSDSHQNNPIRTKRFADGLANLVSAETTLPVLTVGTIASTTIDLSWTADASYTTFKVYRAIAPSGTYTEIYSGTAKTTQATALTPSTLYYFKVTATDAGGFSVTSDPTAEGASGTTTV